MDIIGPNSVSALAHHSYRLPGGKGESSRYHTGPHRELCLQFVLQQLEHTGSQEHRHVVTVPEAHLPEIFSMVADTRRTTGSPGMQPCKSHKPRVQLISHSWTETTLVGRQHLWEPRVWDLDEGNGATTRGTTNI